MSYWFCVHNYIAVYAPTNKPRNVEEACNAHYGDFNALLGNYMTVWSSGRGLDSVDDMSVYLQLIPG